MNVTGENGTQRLRLIFDNSKINESRFKAVMTLSGRLAK